MPFIRYSDTINSTCEVAKALSIEGQMPEALNGYCDYTVTGYPPDKPADIPQTGCGEGFFIWSNDRTLPDSESGKSIENLISENGGQTFNLKAYINITDPISAHYTNNALHYNVCAAHGSGCNKEYGGVNAEYRLLLRNNSGTEYEFFYMLPFPNTDPKLPSGAPGDIAINLKIPLGWEYKLKFTNACYSSADSGYKRASNENNSTCLLKSIYHRVDNRKFAGDSCFTDPNNCDYPRPTGVSLGQSGEYWATFLENGGRIGSKVFDGTEKKLPIDWEETSPTVCESLMPTPFDKGEYPKLFAIILYNIRDAFSEVHDGHVMANVLKNFDIVTIPPEQGEMWKYEGKPGVEWLEEKNPNQLQFAFAPIWYIMPGPGAIRNTHADYTRSQDWILKNIDGTDATWFGRTDLTAVNMTITDYVSWVTDFWYDNTKGRSSAWDGIEGDFNTKVDFLIKDENGNWKISYTRDAYRNAYQDNMKQIFSDLRRKGLKIIGNNSGEPNLGGFDIPFSAYLDATILEDFPVPNPSSATSIWGYSDNGFHSEWERGIYIAYLLKKDGSIPIFINDQELGVQGFRFGLSSALIADAYFGVTPSGYNYGPWYPEYAVDQHGKSIDPEDPNILQYTGWLGNPIEEAFTSDNRSKSFSSMAQTNWQSMGDHVWIRYFDNGVVIVNPTFVSQNITINVPSDGNYKKVDNNSNIGPNISVPARDGLILVKVATAP